MAMKRSVNCTHYCNWIGVKPVAPNRALMCGKEKGWMGFGVGVGGPGPAGPPSDGINASDQPGAPRESDGGSKVEQPRGWSHPLRIGGDNSDVSAPS